MQVLFKLGSAISCHLAYRFCHCIKGKNVADKQEVYSIWLGHARCCEFTLVLHERVREVIMTCANTLAFIVFRLQGRGSGFN